MSFHNSNEQPRYHESLQFGSELGEVISHLQQGVVITGPSGSGKTVLGAAATTLGMAALGQEILPDHHLVPDITLAGFDPKGRFMLEVDEEVSYVLETFVRYGYRLPPIMMIDEILPEHAKYLGELPSLMMNKYQEYGELAPYLIWVVQGTEDDHKAVFHDARFLRDAHQIHLDVKSRDQRANNASYRAAAGRLDKLNESIGSRQVQEYIQSVQAALTARGR